MKKRATNRETAIRKEQLEKLLRGTSYYSYADLMKVLLIDKRSFQRYFKSLNTPKGYIQERKVKDKAGRYIKEFRIFDPSGISNPTFNQAEITQLWANVFNNSDVLLSPIIKNKLIKLVGLRIEPPEYKYLIATVENAIQNHTKVKIDEYFSRDGGSEKNILVTPVYIDVDNRKVFAYILGQTHLKTYKFESIYGIHATETRAVDFSSWVSAKENLDILGFSFKGVKINVHIEFDAFVRSQLIRQFPATNKFISAIGKSRDSFSLKIVVYDKAPICRFIFGVLSKIKIVGSANFKQHLAQYYTEYIEDGLQSLK